MEQELGSVKSKLATTEKNIKKFASVYQTSSSRGRKRARYEVDNSGDEYDPNGDPESPSYGRGRRQRRGGAFIIGGLSPRSGNLGLYRRG
jgi:hypothetical protein